MGFGRLGSEIDIDSNDTHELLDGACRILSTGNGSFAFRSFYD